MRGSQRRQLRAKPGVEQLWKASWSDGTIILRSAPCLLDGFDPGGMFLMFSGGNRIYAFDVFVWEPNFRPFGPIRAEHGSGRFEPRDRRRLEPAAGVPRPSVVRRGG